MAELWFYPGGARILEPSTECPSAEAFQVAAETRGQRRPVLPVVESGCESREGP